MNLVPREAQASADHVHTDPQKTDTREHTTPPGMDHAAAVEYTCPMHPEVVQSEAGSCPKCGMDLEPREAPAEPAHQHKHTDHAAAVEYTCPMHPEVVQSEPGSCPKCGMDLEPREAPAGPAHDHEHMDHAAAIEYTCPMHPEVVQTEPGSCPKCGMDLEPRSMEETHDPGHAGMSTDSEHTGMDHSTMDHGDMAFMSMFDVTRDLPRSSDGLPMEWIEAPFGPFFPGLPGGLLLTLTLDGDTVAGSDSHPLIESADLLRQVPMDTAGFVEQLAGMDPLAPVAYRLLACRALEHAADVDLSPGDTRARIGALERERIASHLGWLALFGQQTGFDWLMQHTAALQLAIQQADLQQIMTLGPALRSLVKRL